MFTKVKLVDVRLEPPGSAGLLAEHHALKIRNGLFEAFLYAHERVFMLDAQHAFVAVQSQRRDKGLPEVVAVAIANGAEDPATILNVAVALDVQHADVAFVGLDNFAVLGVNVEDTLVPAEVASGGDRVNTLPKPVTRIDIGAEVLACCITETDDIFGRVDNHTRVGFESDIDAILGGEVAFFFPERDDDLVPLIVGSFGELGRPWAGYEIRRFVRGASAGAAREVDHNRVELGGQLHTVAVCNTVCIGYRLVGVNRVAVDCDALYFNAEFFE